MKPVSHARRSARGGTYSPRCSSARGTMNPCRPCAASSARKAASCPRCCHHARRHERRPCPLPHACQPAASRAGGAPPAPCAPGAAEPPPGSRCRRARDAPPGLGHEAERPGQDVGEHQIVRPRPPHRRVAPAIRQPRRTSLPDPVQRRVLGGDAHRPRLDVGRQHAAGNRAAPRPSPGCPSRCRDPACAAAAGAPRARAHEAAPGRAVLAGAEGEARIQRQCDPPGARGPAHASRARRSAARSAARGTPHRSGRASPQPESAPRAHRSLDPGYRAASASAATSSGFVRAALLARPRPARARSARRGISRRSRRRCAAPPRRPRARFRHLDRARFPARPAMARQVTPAPRSGPARASSPALSNAMSSLSSSAAVTVP